MWLRTGSKEAGLGQAGGSVPGVGDYLYANNVPYWVQTEIVDHAGRGSAPGATCKQVSNVSASCVNKMLEIGKPMRRFTATYQCQAVVGSIISQCSIISSKAPVDATSVTPRRR